MIEAHSILTIGDCNTLGAGELRYNCYPERLGRLWGAMVENRGSTMATINECEVILSSAMHGLIAADSLAIPNRWLKVSDKLMGGDFKFHDYYSVFDLEPTPWDLRAENNFSANLTEIIARQRITAEMVAEVNNGLLTAFAEFQASRPEFPS